MDCCLHIKVLQWLLSSALVKMIENNMKGRNRKVVNKSEHELLSYKKYKVLSFKVAQWLVSSLPVRSAGSTETTGYWKSPPPLCRFEQF